MATLPLAEIGLWGQFDVDDFDELIVGRVTEAELGRRLPAWSVHRYAPVGYPHPIALDSTPSSALGRWSHDRLADLAAALDFVVIAGSSIVDFDDAQAAAAYDLPPEQTAEVLPSRFFVEGLGAELEARTPVAWSAVRLRATPSGEEGARLAASLRHRAYVSVADDDSRSLLEACGVDTDIHVVGDPALLADEAIPATVLNRRLAYLRGIDAFPAEEDGPAILVEDHQRLVPLAPMISQAVEEVAAQTAASPTIVVLPLVGPYSVDLTAALTATSGRRVIRLPRETVLDDLCAALASARGFVGVSPTCAAVAAAFGRPYALIVGRGDHAADTPTPRAATPGARRPAGQSRQPRGRPLGRAAPRGARDGQSDDRRALRPADGTRDARHTPIRNRRAGRRRARPAVAGARARRAWAPTCR